MENQYTKQGNIIYLNNQPYGRIDDDEVYQIRPLGYLGEWDEDNQQWTLLSGVVVNFNN